MKRKQLLVFAVSLLAVLAVLTAAFLYSRPWDRALFVDPLYRLDTTEKVIALTFDDGPSAARTLPLLELLAEQEVKATFFMLGQNIEQHPDIAKRVYEAGHLIGNHSWDHPRLIFRSPAFIREQILRTDRLIMSLGQTEVMYMRPPYSYKFMVLPWVLKSMGKQLVTGTYDPPAEYAVSYNAEKVADQVVANARPGAVIYLHDGKSSDVEAFVESVRLIIAQLSEKGYRFVRLDEAASLTGAY